MVQAARVVALFFDILYWLLFIRIIISWIPHNPDGPVFRILYEGTEPILAPFRRLIPRGSLPIDISPIIAFFVLRIVRDVIVRALLRM